MRTFIGILCLATVLVGSHDVRAQSGEAVSTELKQQSLATLQSALAEQSKFVKVHAAEALLRLSYGADVVAIFEKELELHADEPPYRLGIWRVLTRAASDRHVASTYLQKMSDVALDQSASDQATALESLAKLKYQIPQADRAKFAELTFGSKIDAHACWRWLLATTGNEQDVVTLADLLDDAEPRARDLAAYGLRHLGNLPPAAREKLVAAANHHSEVCYFVSAAYVTAADAAQAQHFKELLLPFAKSDAQADRYETAAALAQRGTVDDLPLLRELLSDPDEDVRISAADAVLRIDRRRPLPFKWLDLWVLAAYAAGMLAIGWYFSRGNTTSEVYLLGGRRMKALPVGLSYFATMFSTISYLSVPGEVIKNGPMWISGILALPFAYVVVGYFLVPFIMRLNITTAYEILEKRFGLSVRMLGSGIFVALRLAWMGTILFGMSHHVLVPLLGLDPAATPWVTATLGLITVAYTAMGGLQAVVWTDVAQTFVLMLGAILSIVMISVYLGGSLAWWPSAWPGHWETPKFWFDPTARLTIASVALSVFTWHICTAGGDQMAVQRYLATNDAPAARQMFGFSLLCDAFVAILLNLLGISLFSFFHANPQLLPDNETITSGADQLLPQFIVKGLPAGISGLVISGLAAAAMSSLASGVSSTCSVVAVDWIGRLRKTQASEGAQVRLARMLSWLIGAIIVALSLVAGAVEGNLLETAFKFINMFTVPLFVLFFMAMFVPRATVWGTWTAGIASFAAAVIVAHTHYTGLSFIWMMPVSLATGIVIGFLTSFIPLGKKRPMLLNE